MGTAIWRSAVLWAALSSALHADDTISFCPGPDERYRSALYEVRSAGGEPAFVYCRENGWKQVPDTDGGTWPCPVMSADNHWVGLSADGDVRLTIRTVGMKPETAELLPERPGNTVSVMADGSVQVKLKVSAEHPG